MRLRPLHLVPPVQGLMDSDFKVAATIAAYDCRIPPVRQSSYLLCRNLVSKSSSYPQWETHRKTSGSLPFWKRSNLLMWPPPIQRDDLFPHWGEHPPLYKRRSRDWDLERPRPSLWTSGLVHPTPHSRISKPDPLYFCDYNVELICAHDTIKCHISNKWF